MTRINCIPVTELCDQHLVAEYKEMLRFRSTVPRWLGAKKPAKIPAAYKMGAGHVTFFNDKLMYLTLRHVELRDEMVRRGFKCNYKLDFGGLPGYLNNNWQPNEKAIITNKKRIVTRLRAMNTKNKMPRWTNTKAPDWAKE